MKSNCYNKLHLIHPRTFSFGHFALVLNVIVPVLAVREKQFAMVDSTNNKILVAIEYFQEVMKHIYHDGCVILPASIKARKASWIPEVALEVKDK